MARLVAQAMSLVLILVLSVYASAAPRKTAGAHFENDAGRILLDVQIETPSGLRTALAWFNMGMAKPIVTEALAREISLNETGALVVRVAGQTLAAPSIEVTVGDDGFGHPSFAHLFAPRLVELMLPASMLRDYILTLDYPAQVFALRAPETVRPKGVAIPLAIHPQTGLAAIAADIGGRRENFVIDAGAGYSWMRGDLGDALLQDDPSLLRATGAVGQSNSNMVDFDLEKRGRLMRAPLVLVGTDARLELGAVGFLATAPLLGAFAEKFTGNIFWGGFARAAPTIDGEPVAGWLGANALQPFVITIDYPNAVSYWRRVAPALRGENDQPALTIVRRQGDYLIGGFAHDNALDGNIVIGDCIESVDGVRVPGLSRGAVLDLLHGVPGAPKRLVLDRHGARYEIQAPVASFD
ncbi:MAG: hypothetical protein PHX18_09065 [Candidatus Gastranaerophilales bacterium]|nr:hypothetical protein [Candidatus Gastranaerophilales bacterium]